MGAELSTPDLSSYATKTSVTEIDNKVKAIDLTKYYSKSEVDSKLSNIASTPGPKGADGAQGPIGPAGPSGPISSMPASFASQGAYIGWNKDVGLGRTLIANNRGAGPGGFDFIDYNSAGEVEVKYATWTPDSVQFHKNIKDKDGNIVGGNIDINKITSDLSGSLDFQNKVASSVVTNNKQPIIDVLKSDQPFKTEIKGEKGDKGTQGPAGTIGNNSGLTTTFAHIGGTLEGDKWKKGLNIANTNGSWTHFNSGEKGENYIRGATNIQGGQLAVENADKQITFFNHPGNLNYIRGTETIVDSKLTANGDLNTHGTLTTHGKLIANDLDTRGTLTANGNLTAKNNLTVEGNLCIKNDKSTVCLSPLGGNLVIWKGNSLDNSKVLEFGNQTNKIAWA